MPGIIKAFDTFGLRGRPTSTSSSSTATRPGGPAPGASAKTRLPQAEHQTAMARRISRRVPDAFVVDHVRVFDLLDAKKP